MDSTDLAQYLEARDDQLSLVEQCWSEAVELVSAFVGTATVPQVMVDRATLETATELFNRRKATNGVVGFGSQDGVPVFVARDPMQRSYPLLRRWVLPF